MIFPLILTLAAICQVAPAYPSLDDLLKLKAKASYDRFMVCARETLNDFKRMGIVNQNVELPLYPSEFSHNIYQRGSGFEPVGQRILIEPVERKVETKPVGSQSLHPFLKRHGFTQQTFNEKTQTTRNSGNVSHRAVYINDTRVTWNEARNRCIDNKAELAIIDSAETEAFMIDFLKKHNITRAWIGVHSLFGDNQWTTVKGDRLESLPYVHWGDYQPDNYGGNERCVVLNQRGMNDLPCDSEAECACQWLE